MAKGRKQADHRADTRGSGWNGLPHAVADSLAYLALGPFERAVLYEILRKFNGYNNGDVAISYEELGHRLRGSNKCPPNNARIGRAVARLMQHGLIAEPTPASWLQRKSRTYRLTFITSGKGPPFKSATNEYLRWTPDRVKNDGDAASPEKGQSSDAGSPKGNRAGNAQSPTNLKIGNFASSNSEKSGDAASLLIVIPYPPAANLRGSHPRIVRKSAQRNCAHCGEPFVSIKPTKAYCGRVCKERAKARRHYRRGKMLEAHGETGDEPMPGWAA